MMIDTILRINRYVACWPWSTAAAKTMPDDDMQDVSEAEDEEDVAVEDVAELIYESLIVSSSETIGKFQ